MRIRNVMLALLIALAAGCSIPALAGAHVIYDNGTDWAPDSGSGCFDPLMEFGDKASGMIHMYALIGYRTNACGTSGGINDSVSGTGQMMLMKFTGIGEYGGWTVCLSWLVNRSTGVDIFGQINRHVDVAPPCGSGTYALAMCAGPPGNSSVYRMNTSTYVRNCSDDYVNWVFSNGTHYF